MELSPRDQLKVSLRRRLAFLKRNSSSKTVVGIPAQSTVQFRRRRQQSCIRRRGGVGVPTLPAVLLGPSVSRKRFSLSQGPVGTSTRLPELFFGTELEFTPPCMPVLHDSCTSAPDELKAGKVQVEGASRHQRFQLEGRRRSFQSSQTKHKHRSSGRAASCCQTQR